MDMEQLRALLSHPDNRYASRRRRLALPCRPAPLTHQPPPPDYAPRRRPARARRSSSAAALTSHAAKRACSSATRRAGAGAAPAPPLFCPDSAPTFPPPARRRPRVSRLTHPRAALVRCGLWATAMACRQRPGVQGAPAQGRRQGKGQALPGPGRLYQQGMLLWPARLLADHGSARAALCPRTAWRWRSVGEDLLRL